MKFYKFRPLCTCCDYDRVLEILRHGFYCCSFLDFNDVNEGVFPVSEKTIDVELNDKLEYKICSFSDENALPSQLMWGHYAEAGMGVAIEIEVNPVGPLVEVKYGLKDRHNGLVEILTNKSSQWDYEHEWRYLSETQDQYYKAEITKIYFGTPYATLINYEEIKLKHRTLQKYLRHSASLRQECDKRKIRHKNYPL
jgi:hypothetical protein